MTTVTTCVDALIHFVVVYGTAVLIPSLSIHIIFATYLLPFHSASLRINEKMYLLRQCSNEPKSSHNECFDFDFNANRGAYTIT